MNKKILVLVGALAITVLAGGFALAQTAELSTNTMPRGGFYRNVDHCVNNEGMIDIMAENGFEEMATAMEQRDFDAMDNFMNNLTDEEYEQMVEIMQENGYGRMTRMMDSIGREDMIERHNQMMGGRRNRMGRFNN